MKKWLINIGVLFLWPVVLLAQNTTGAPLNLALPNFNQPNWGVPVNKNFTAINAAFGLSLPGIGSITPGTNVTCTPFVSGSCVGNVTINATGGGGGGTPASPNLSLQFNNGGSFGGSTALTTDSVHQALLMNVLNPTPNASVCTATPALCVVGLWNSPTQAQAQADPIGISIVPNFAYPGFDWGNPGPGGWSTQHGLFVNMNTYTRGISQTESSELFKYATGDSANYHYVFSYGGTTAQSDEGVSGESAQTIQLNNFYKGTVNGTQTTGAQSLTSAITTGGPTCDGCYLVNRTTGAITGGNFATSAIISAYTFDGTATFVFTAANALIVGQTVSVYAFPTSTWINFVGTVTAVSGTQFTLNVADVTHAPASATELGVVYFTAFPVTGTSAVAQQVAGVSLAPSSARGTVNTTMAVNPAANPLVYTATVDVTDVVSSFPTTANLVGCLTGGQPEQVLFTASAPSTGHQSVSITYRQPHGGSQIGEPTTLWYGGPCGYYIDQLQQTASSRGNGTLPSTYFVVGALDASHVVYAWNIHGGTGGNSFPTYTIPTPYNAVTRTGSTVTGTIAGGGSPAILNSQSAATVIASTNSAFLGTATSPTEVYTTGNPTGISFTQAGTNGDTANEIIVTLPVSFDAFNMYCGGEVTSPSTPSPGSPTTIHLEPNNCVWNGSDVIWNPPNPSFNGNGIFDVVQQYTPSNPGFSGGISMVISGSGIDGDYIPFNAQFTNSSDMYQGHGGTMVPPTFMNIQGDGGSQAGQPTTPLGTMFRIQNSGIGGAPVILVNSDEFGTNQTTQTLAQMENGSIRYYNPTATWYLNNLDVGNVTVHGSQNFPSAIATNSITLGDSTDIGIIKWSVGSVGVPIVANIQHCNLFSTDDFLGVNSANGNCSQAIGGYLPNGALGMGDLYALNSANLNNLQVGRGTPVNILSVVYSGVAGAVGRSYELTIENALGQEGNVGTGGTQFAAVANTATTLDGSHFVTITCPTALQYGLASGDIYVAYSQNISSGAWTRVGTCPVSSTLVDNGSAASVVGTPIYNANSSLATGGIILAPAAGGLQWLTDIYHPTTFSAGISQPTAGTISFDTGTPGNAGALLSATQLTLKPTVFSALPSCASGTEGSTRAVTDSTTNTWGATVTGTGTNHVLAYCDGTNWTVGAK